MMGHRVVMNQRHMPSTLDHRLMLDTELYSEPFVNLRDQRVYVRATSLQQG